MIKILLLEDVPSDTMLVQAALNKSGLAFDMHIVDGKARFQSALEEFSYDIVLSDHSLPSFNSYEALRLIREAGITVPFILITATMTDELAVSIIQKGAQDYIIKDRLQRLPSAVTYAIEKYRVEREHEAAHERTMFHIENTALGYIERDSGFQIKVRVFRGAPERRFCPCQTFEAG